MRPANPCTDNRAISPSILSIPWAMEKLEIRQKLPWIASLKSTVKKSVEDGTMRRWHDVLVCSCSMIRRQRTASCNHDLFRATASVMSRLRTSGGPILDSYWIPGPTSLRAPKYKDRPELAGFSASLFTTRLQSRIDQRSQYNRRDWGEDDERTELDC